MTRGVALRAARALQAPPRSGPPSQHSVRAVGRQSRGLHGSPTPLSETIGAAARLPEAEEVPAHKAPGRVTISDILERRARAGKLVAGTAAASNSDMFKAPSVGKPMAKRWDHHLTEESKLRRPCMLKEAAKHLKKPGLISLGGGLPCPEYFPFESLSIKVPTPPGFSEEATRATGRTVSVGKYDTAEREGAVYDLAVALNYGQATGSAQLLRFVTEHTELVSDPPYADWASCLTVGSTGALEQALRMFCDRRRRDAVLMDEFAFSTALETAEPLGVRVFGVPADDEGLVPERMDAMLAGWDEAARGGARRPHLLYTVPSGQNPTGATMGAARRRELYAVCQKYDVFILEDEPYYYLQMPPYGGGRDKAGPPTAPPPGPAPGPAGDTTTTTTTTTTDEFLQSLLPTLLSMDVDGRVLRLDSFSKVAVPGARTGWVTGPAQVVERYVRHAEVASQGPAGVSQVLLWKLLDETWGHEGYLRWLMHLRGEYARRRDAMAAACEEFLPVEVVSWAPPQAGMFQWLKVNYDLHPDAGRRGVLEIEEEIYDRCIEGGVLVARGSWFAAERDRPPGGLFFRATFAAATPDRMREAIRRFGEAVRKSYRL